MAEDKNIKPWERMPGESAKVYTYFEYYRSLEASKRSARLVGEKFGKTVRCMENHCTDYDWVRRAEAWDDEQLRIAREDQQKEIRI